jgi:hypothetical protein
MIKNIFKYNFSTLLMVDLKKLRDIIQELEKIHQLYILNLIITRSVPYSENSNGVFINMSVIAPKVLTEIQNYLKYVELQENQLEDDEVLKANYKKSLFKDNKDILS